ncbi:MAG: glutamate dehydrogenase, partial [Candidatus Brocadiaceae bacterium]
YGNAGYYAGLFADTLYGCRVIAVSDSRGGIINRDGLDPDEVAQHKAETGSVVGFPGSQPLSNEELLVLDADILIPAALENVITESNAGEVRASIVAELANGPTTPGADDILYRNGVHVLPDFLCNAGGVTVSYFEMVQNFSMYYWTEEEVHQRLDAKLTSAYHAVLGTSKQHGVNMREAAYVVAVRRVAEAMKLRGWV